MCASRKTASLLQLSPALFAIHHVPHFVFSTSIFPAFELSYNPLLLFLSFGRTHPRALHLSHQSIGPSFLFETTNLVSLPFLWVKEMSEIPCLIAVSFCNSNQNTQTQWFFFSFELGSGQSWCLSQQIPSKSVLTFLC